MKYKVIRYCMMCKKKFFVNSRNNPKRYCDECQKKYGTDKMGKDVEED